MTPVYPLTWRELPNGLCVVVSEDHASPGSARVAPGEHAALVRACGGQHGAGVGPDTAAYFQHVPAQAAELALWLEAERMDSLADTLDEQTLAAQPAAGREQDAGHGELPADLEQRLLALVYPTAHPYHRPPAGYPGDLDDVSLASAGAFFQACYAPGNAVLAVVGDVVPSRVLAAAESCFGLVPAGPAPRRPYAAVLGPATGQARDDACGPVPSAVTAFGLRLPADSATSPDLAVSAAYVGNVGRDGFTVIAAGDPAVLDGPLRELAGPGPYRVTGP